MFESYLSHSKTCNQLIAGFFFVPVEGMACGPSGAQGANPGRGPYTAEHGLAASPADARRGSP